MVPAHRPDIKRIMDFKLTFFRCARVCVWPDKKIGNIGWHFFLKTATLEEEDKGLLILSRRMKGRN